MRPLHGQFSQGEPPAATPAVTSCLTNVGLTHDFLSLRGSRQYADPVSDLLDKWGAFRCRLFRESCVFHRGNYVKDLSRLGRDLSKVIIVDNSPASYVFHPDNAVSIPPADSHTVAFLPFSSSVCEFSGFFCLFVFSHLPPQVPVASWFDDMSDTELLDLIPFFERLSKVDNVYAVLKHQGAAS